MDLNGKRVLITGASGFIGSHLLSRLVTHENAEVRAFLRPTSNLSSLQQYDFEHFYGDIKDYNSVVKALKGVNIVIHCAATVSSSGRYGEFRMVNIEGTKNILQATLINHTDLLIYISSIVVYGYTHTKLLGEGTPYNKTGWPYADTKIEAEKEVLRFSQRYNFPVVVIRAGDTLGPGSTWVKNPVRLIKEGKLHLVNGTGMMNYIWVDDLIEAIILAATSPKASGNIYNVTSGDVVNFEQYFKDLCWLLGYSVPHKVSYPVAYLGGIANELYSYLKGQPSELTRHSIRYLLSEKTVKIQKVRDELGWEPKVFYQGAIDRLKKIIN